VSRFGGHPIAVVDPDASARRLLRTRLEAVGFEVVEFSSGTEALRGQSPEWTAVCLALELEDLPGFDALKHLRARDVSLPVVVVAMNQDIDTVIQAIRLGACDYVTKPFEPERVLRVLGEEAERRRLPWSAKEEGALIGSIIGQSAQARSLARQIERVLQSDVSVCIFGETGTGKELVARAIHEEGPRARGPFVAVNCAAFTESLLESELFGYEKGAFTGAFSLYRGCFERAQGGTLFLDEVGEMISATQVRLLRALQERTIRRVGGSSEIRVDVRIIAATHRDLMAEVKVGRFREDLYYRLAVYPIQVPPLRERVSDIPLLADHVCKKLGGAARAPGCRFSEEALQALMRYRWPGNVRELENVIQRALLSCDGARIELAHLPAELSALVLPSLPATPVPTAGPCPGAVVPLRELERREILKALTVTNGSVTKAAKLLGLGRATLYRRLGELRIQLAPESVSEDSGRTPS
jgi:DNA-binding NtrC family response regulator